MNNKIFFCKNCGNTLINGSCNNCFDSSNALKEFEEEND